MQFRTVSEGKRHLKAIPFEVVWSGQRNSRSRQCTPSDRFEAALQVREYRIPTPSQEGNDLLPCHVQHLLHQLLHIGSAAKQFYHHAERVATITEGERTNHRYTSSCRSSVLPGNRFGGAQVDEPLIHRLRRHRRKRPKPLDQGPRISLHRKQRRELFPHRSDNADVLHETPDALQLR